MKHKAVSIRLARAEGPTPLPEPVTLTGEAVWEQARRVLVGWSISAPGHPGDSCPIGVDKTDFTVTYDDGNTYDGTFGLTYSDQDLAAHMRGFLSTLLDRKYIKYLERSEQETADVRKFLDQYEIGA